MRFLPIIVLQLLTNSILGQSWTNTSTSNTIGDKVPLITEDRWLNKNDQFATLVGGKENTSFRTNIGYVWTGGRVLASLDFYDIHGTMLGSYSLDTDNIIAVPEGAGQVNRILRYVSSTYDGIFNIKIRNIGGNGRIFFYKSTVDNISGDSVVTGQQRYASDGSVWNDGGKLQ